MKPYFLLENAFLSGPIIDKSLVPIRLHGRQSSWDPVSCDSQLQLWEHCMFMQNFLLVYDLPVSLSSGCAGTTTTPWNWDYACLQNQLPRRDAFAAPAMLPVHTLNAPQQDSLHGFKQDGLTCTCLRTASPHRAEPSEAQRNQTDQELNPPATV